MENLFTKTSHVLRDNFVLELKNNNDFLRNKLSNINLNPFFGYKVRILSHLNGMTQENFPETMGVIYSLQKGQVWALYKDDEGNRKMKRFYIKMMKVIEK
jgi:hypothetical protein